jgi:hypothetical protein
MSPSRPIAAAPTASLLRLSAWERLGISFCLIALMWLTVWLVTG